MADIRIKELASAESFNAKVKAFRAQFKGVSQGYTVLYLPTSRKRAFFLDITCVYVGKDKTTGIVR